MINADDMQSWAYLLAPTFQFVNTAGKPLTEGWIEVYIAGTRNKYYCASDFNGTLHPFQIPLDSLGANIVLADPDQAYDVYVYNKYGSLIMSRYHVSPGMAGGSGVLNITITSEDGTVTVNNDGNGNFDLSIQDTVDRIDALEQAVSGLSADSTVGYAIAHAYTVNLDGTFNLINDSVSGIGYTSNMDGFRLKSGHIYQFNFNALFENGAFDRNCSGKLYLEGPNTIAQEWKFDLDDSYYHSQSFNGSTVLLTPRDLNYYDLKLKLAWDVDYPNKPNIDLNKISLVDITTIISTTVSGMGGDYTAGDGIYINDETNVISVDMDYINNHLNINVDEIVASAVNIATAYTDARVTTVSGDLVNLIAEVSASIPTGIEQVQSDWTELDSSSPAYINNKPDLTIYATNASVSAVSSVLQSEIDAISGAIPTDYVTHDEVSAVSGNIIEYVNSVSGDLVETINNVSGDIIHTVVSVSGDIIETVNNVSGDIIHTVETVSGDIIETITTVSGDVIETVNNVSGDIIHTVESVSGDLVEIIETATANIPEQVNADWEAVSGKAEILNKPDLSVYATHTEVSGVSAVLNERINNVSGDLIETITTVSGDIINTVETVSAVLEGDIVSAIQVATGAIPEQVNSDWNAVSGKAEILNKPDLSIYATHDELVDAVTAVSSMIPTDYVTHNEVSAVSANLVNYVNSVSGDVVNYVDESIVSAINVATGSFEQVQSDWTEDDTNDPAYIQNKPNEIELIAGQNIGIFSTDSTITIAASATDISGLATHSEVNTVSGILESEIQAVSAAIGEQVPNVSIQSPSGSLVVTETVSGNNKIYSIDVAPTSGIEYGQFYATNITGAATMARTKGNIDITNDGKIKLKQGQSYHVTVRGRYNQTVLKDNYSYASYIEYVTNNSININVDESRSGSQYFELSYDLFKLNNDTDYYVFFTLDDATVNDLFIDIHSLANVGSNGSSGGSSPEYDAGYGIQILNNVISVSGIAPQVQSDWNQTDTSSVDYIKNKPEEYGLIAGDNISITASGNNFVISSTASAATGIDYQAGYGIDITDDTISVDASIIPSTSAYATHTEVNNVSAAIIAQIPEQQVNSDWTATSGVAEILNKPNESELIAGPGVSITASGSNYIISAVVTGSPVLTGYVTESELQTVSGNIVNQIPDISGLATNADLQIVSAAIPDISSLASKSEVNAVSGTLQTEIVAISGAMVDVPTGVSGVVAGQGISITASGSDYVISCTVTGGGAGDVTQAELETVSGSLHTEIVNVSAAIPTGFNQVQSDWEQTIVSAVDYIKNKPEEAGLIAGDNISITASGNNFVVNATVPDVSNLATKTELATVSAAIPDVSGFATVELVSAVSGKLPTTELGKFTIHSNVSGGPIDVIVPTDQAPDSVFYQIDSVSGNTYAPSTNNAVITYYYGETPADFNGSDDAILFTINDNISNINNIAFFYTNSNTGMGGPYLSPTNITGGSPGVVQSGTYKVKAQYNQGVTYGYGKYLQIMLNWRNYASDPEQSLQWVQEALSKITFFGVVRPDPSLGTTVNLDRYYLGNTSTTTNTSNLTQATIYTDPTSKKQSVYLPYSIPSNWKQDVNVLLQYGTTSNPNNALYTYYGAYKQESGTSNMQYAVCVDHNWTNKIMTFISFDKNGDAFEKWTYNWGTSPKTWTTESISSGSTYTAGDYIGITDDTISVTGITDLVAGDNITITASGSSAIISATGGEGDVTIEELASVSGTLETEIQTVSAALDSADIPTGVSGLVGGTNVSITASGSNYVIDATVPTLPTEEEVDFEEVDLRDYALASAVTTELANKQNTLTGITDIQVVQSLPVSPVSSVLYLIPEV